MEDLQQKIIELMDLFDEGEVTTADKIDRPQRALDREAIDDFMKRNPMAGGGMLVQPSADGSRPGYSKSKKEGGDFSDSYFTNRITDKKRLKILDEVAKKYGYKNFESVPQPKQKEPGKRPYGDRQKILQDATRRQKGIPEGKGSPGVPRPVGEDFVSPMKDPKVAAQVVANRKLKFQESEFGKRIQWIANNGKNYSDPEKFKKAYEKHFKHKIGSKKDALFNFDEGAPGLKKGSNNQKLINYRQVDNMTFPGTKSVQPLSTIMKNFSEDELFKASIIQNNPEVQKQFKELFKQVHNNVSELSELGPESLVETLNKGKLFQDFDFIKSYVIGNREIGGVHTGIVRASLLNVAGVNPEHLTSFQSVRKPIMAISKIIENLKNPSFAKDFGISPSTATKIRDQLNNFLEGEKNLIADIRKINNQLGDVKFNNIFGGVNFEHTLAKQFGKDYKYLPRNYLLKGQFTTKAFNMFKRDAFDLPLIRLMKQYEQGKVTGKQVQNFIDDFNVKTNGYADFSFDPNKKKLAYADNSVKYDLSRYTDPTVARQELIDNIKLTMSDEFQKGFKTSLPTSSKFATKDTLKIFKSPEAKNVLKLLEELGCGKSGGGRVLLSTGTPGLTKCALAGQKVMDNGLMNGFKNKRQVDLAGLILKGGAGLKSAFALRNIFGPAAVAATVAFEGGLIGYDMLTSGKTLREAFGDNLLNYALGKDYQIDPQEELFKRFKGLGYDDQQIGSIKRSLDAMNTINTGAQLAMDVGQQQEALQKSRGQPEPFMSPDDQMMADTAGQRAEQNLKDAKNQLAEFNRDLVRSGQQDELSRYIESGDYAKGFDLFKQAQKEADIQKLESAGPKFTGSVFPQFEERRQEDLANLRSVINPAFNIPGMREATGGYLYGFANGGITNLVKEERAGYKLGKGVKTKPSKVRSDAKSIIDENIKLIKQMKETGEIDEISSDLNQVIKKALDEDLFDKKDRIVDSINISEAKIRRNYPYNMQVFEEPKNLDFYTAIQESNFKTKTGPYFDRIRKNKAVGGLLKQAGDRSGAPPESGPNSQGLQGLLNRGKNI